MAKSKRDRSQTAVRVALKATGTNTFETNPKVLTLASAPMKPKRAKRKNLEPAKSNKTKTKTPKKQVTDAQPETKGRDWFSEPASPKWTGRRIKNMKTGKEYVIGDVFGERHVEMDRDGQTTIHNAANLRGNYEPI
jgi:hypothetical protein